MLVDSIHFEETVFPSFAPCLNVCALCTGATVHLVRPGESDSACGSVKSSGIVTQCQGVGKEVRPPLTIASFKAPFQGNILEVAWSSCSKWLCIVYGSIDSAFALSVAQVSGDFDVLQTFVSEDHELRSAYPVLNLTSFGSVSWGEVGVDASQRNVGSPAIDSEWTRLLASSRPQALPKTQSINYNSAVTEALQRYMIPPLYIANGAGDKVVCLDSGLIYSQCTSVLPPCGISGSRLIRTSNGVLFHRHDTISNSLFSVGAGGQVTACGSPKSLGLIVHSCLHVSHNLRQIIQGWRSSSLKLLEELRLVKNSTIDITTVSVLLDSIMGTVGVTDSLDHIIDYFGLPQIKDPEDPGQADSQTPAELSAYHYHKRLFDTCTDINEKAVDLDVLSRAVEKLEERFTTVLLLFTDQIDTALELARSCCPSLSLALQSFVPQELSSLREVVSLLKASISAEFSRLMLLSRYIIMMKSEICRAASQSKVTRDGLQPAEQLALVEYLGVLGEVGQVPWILALSLKMNENCPVTFLHQVNESAFLKKIEATMRSLLSDQVVHITVPTGLVLPLSSLRSCCVVLDACAEGNASVSDDGCGDLETPLPVSCLTSPHLQMLMSLSVSEDGVVLKQQSFDGSKESKDFPIDIDMSGRNVICFKKADNDDALLLGAVNATHLSVWVIELPSVELVEFGNRSDISILLPPSYSEGDPINLSLSLSSRMLMCGIGGRMEVIDVDLEEDE